MGRLLALFVRERSTLLHIANIRDDNGYLQSDPLRINARFAFSVP